MTLNSAAIDAAGRALYHDEKGHQIAWNVLDPAVRSVWTERAHIALQAAVPFLVPTREQIAQAIFDSPTGEDWYACQEAADAVLALIGASPCCAHPKCPGGSICCCQTGVPPMSDPILCRHCGEPIWQTNMRDKRWVHTANYSTICEPTTHAEPEEEP